MSLPSATMRKVGFMGDTPEKRNPAQGWVQKT
jgi:hypothetical protein